MYARLIFPVGFKRLVWASLFLCFCLWYFCGSAIAKIYVYTPGSPPSPGDYMNVGDKIKIIAQTAYYPHSASGAPEGPFWMYPSSILFNMPTSSPGYYNQYYFSVQIVSLAEYNGAVIKYTDTDSDGLADYIDPCSNSTDDNLTVYRTKNRCTGSYYFFQVTGSCGETKTYFNPQYSTLNAAFAAANSASRDCFDATRDTDRISMTVDELSSWHNSNSANSTASAGEAPVNNPFTPDPTGGNNTSSVPPKPVDATDPDNQKIIDQIERMKSGLESVVRDTSDKVRSQVEISGNSIVGALKGLGGTDRGVQSAIGSASGTAHADAQALGSKLDLLASKLGTPSNSTYGGLSKTEMDQALELDRQETFKVETGVFDSIETSQNTLFDKITSRSNELKTKVQSLIPDFEVETNNAVSCVPATVVSMHGSSITMPEICLTPFESYFVMLGNILYGAACIGSILTIFGFRG